MDPKLIFLGFLYFTIGQILIWFQSHLQFFNNWSKDNPFIISIAGIAVSYVSILATKHLADAFDGLVWPSRLIGFGKGIVIFSYLIFPLITTKLNLKI